ncbi:MAG TPA: GTP 3',8-cyclase MoaA [Acidothermaceae bacterium]
MTKPRFTAQPIDTRARPLRDLRISVTDRCNLRCRYCMPREVFGPGFVFLPRTELLHFEEIARVVGAFARAGVTKVRLTGGEPLLRAGLADLVAMVAAVPGVDDIALTTNGSLLARHAERLRTAGLTRITVSLDTLDEETFAKVADSEVTLSSVLDGIAAAATAGFAPLKLNAVIRRNWNEADVEGLAAYARERGHTMRFIEYMDVGDTNGWRLDDVVPAAEIVDRIAAVWPLEVVSPGYPGEVANRYRYLDGSGEVGVISSISKPFCGTCTRARLSAIGEVYTCLFATTGHDLRALLRSGGSDADLDAAIAGIWTARADRYSELRAAHASHEGPHKVEMSYIGG